MERRTTGMHQLPLKCVNATLGEPIPVVCMPSIPHLKEQEIPLDDPESTNMFQPTPDKPLLATPAAIELYSHEVILACWRILREKAEEQQGLDYLQVFEDETKAESLWFIEDGEGGAITALLPSDY